MSFFEKNFVMKTAVIYSWFLLWVTYKPKSGIRMYV